MMLGVLASAIRRVMTSSVPPPAIGEYWEGQGGWYAGTDTYNGTVYHIVLADKEADVAGLPWKTSNTYSGVFAGSDGMAATQTMVNLGIDLHPAAKHCVEYRGGGFSDWYMPSQLELITVTAEIAGRGQFAAGSPQANEPTAHYWGAYEYQAATAVSDLGGGGGRVYVNKTLTTRRVRPIRRVVI